ncbi:MRL1 [Symbiodinium natans]|uniref:MRL1 protein n=1 Tax=Symbiodinium natans TaxID=878477 RepID=A0A812IXX1_9DINO|nr:MRL1 [Symbiodinium natans]
MPERRPGRQNTSTTQRRQIVYNRSITSCRRHAGWEDALAILNGMPSASLQADLVGYSSTMSVCDAASQWQRATSLLEATTSTIGCPDVIMYGAGMNACRKGQQWQQAIRLLKELRDSLRVDVVTWNTAMCGPSSGGWQNATHLLGAGVLWSLQPSMVSYNVAMRGGVGWKVANQLLLAAVNNKLRATVTTCGTILASDQIPWVMELVLLSDMQCLHLQLNIISCSSALSACEKAAEWATSLWLLASAKAHSLQPNEFALSAATSGCEQTAEWQMASHLLCVDMGPRQSILSWNSCASAAAAGLAWCHVGTLLRALPARSLEADLLTMSAAVSAMVGKRRWALALLCLCKHAELDTESDVIIYSTGMTACQECQEWHWALQLLKTASLNDLLANDVAFNAVVAACEQAEQSRGQRMEKVVLHAIGCSVVKRREE